MKETLKFWFECTFYSIFLNVVWWVMIHYHLADSPDDIGDLGWFIVFCTTFFGGNYFIRIHDKYRWKKKVMKLARQVAEYQGIDPKTLDFEDFDVIEDEDGIIEIIIYKKPGEGEKK